MSEMEKKNLNDLTLILKNSGRAGIGQFFNILLRCVYTVVGTRLLGAAIYFVLLFLFREFQPKEKKSMMQILARYLPHIVPISWKT